MSIFRYQVRGRGTGSRRIKTAIAWGLIGSGICIAVFSQKIVFSGLELLLGIETIVGKENVVYDPEGGYAYTNPGAMIRWIVAVAWVGMLIAAIGAVALFRTRPPGLP